MATRLLCLMLVVFAAALPVMAGRTTEQTAREREAEQRRQALTQDINQIDNQKHDIEHSLSKLKEQRATILSDQDTAKTEQSKVSEAARSATKDVESGTKAAADAKIKSDAADKALKAAQEQARQKYEAAPEFQQTKQELSDARDAAAVAKTVALTPLKSKPEYMAADKSVRDASARVEALKLADPVNPTAVSDAAKDLLARQAAVSALEQAALAADPAYQAADARVSAATKAMAAQQAAVNDKTKTDPDRVAAANAAQDAQDAEDKLQAALKSAQQRMTAAKSAMGKASDRVQSLTDQLAKAQKDIDRKESQLDDLDEQRARKVRQLQNTR